MTDRPILFSSSMIRALMDGRKSQTRRLLKPNPSVAFIHCVDGRWIAEDEDADLLYQVPLMYAPGDRLWVREAALFWVNTADDSLSHVAAFKADGYELEPGERWRSSIHMPRWASRLTLTVTDVRVQRLQDITCAEVRAEGAINEGWDEWREDVRCIAPSESVIEDERHVFARLWNSLHGPGAWDANPWCVALTFDVHRGNIDQMETKRA
jgi:hypothetical protein